MTVKVAAKEIVERFINIIPCNDNELSEDEMYKEQLHSAKRCALICVDEKIADALIYGDVNSAEGHLKEVKEEINKL
jgi:phosphotransacetylase